MKPILLIHGYSSEGKDNKVEDIYGTLPDFLKKEFGEENIESINLSRWISLNDGVRLDDISFAMERALNSDQYRSLLSGGFHVIIHSTGALVVRNWIRKYSAKPSPIINLIHLAGANFGSGLAHIGQGRLSRWGRYLFGGTGVGKHILQALEFGSAETLNLQTHFLTSDNDIYEDYQVQEFCIIGSQTLSFLRQVPIRYVKEDSSDNTVRTSAGNLNFNYILISPTKTADDLTVKKLNELIEKRKNNETFKEENYQYDLTGLSENRQPIPFTIAYETAHFGDDIGIVTGKSNRSAVIPLVIKALKTAQDKIAYTKMVQFFEQNTSKTFQRVTKLKGNITDWDKQAQYEAHAQLIFRLTDQYGRPVEEYDITFKSKNKKMNRLESMIEDDHVNEQNPANKTLYLRTQQYDSKSKTWINLMDNISPLNMEVTGVEAHSKDIAYVPVNISLSSKQLQQVVQNFTTTIVDIQLIRLPSSNVFTIKQI
ncbi:hypothetical protein [Aliikangiella maris]|uniref:Alpha/beta hydrolase n=2 Tax=Aliikangiella maris TaxID=3162458 RepID=A0ABV3MQA0_9GAMM